MKKILLLIACVAMLVGCGKTVKEVIPIPASFSPVYSLISKDDISTDDAQMLRVKVTLPKHLSEAEIIENFRSFVIDNYDKTGIRNVAIFAYNNEAEANGSYTIAMYEFCPYGDWSRTNESVTNDKYAENYTVNSSYFEPAKTTLDNGTKIELSAKEEWDSKVKEFIPAKTTSLSSSPTDFSEDKIIKLKNGTAGTIIDMYSQTMTGGSKWIAYKVTLSNGKTGWVLAEDVTQVK